MSDALRALFRRAHGQLPPAPEHGVESFYALGHELDVVCDGTACHFAGGPGIDPQLPRVRCVGHCYEAPSRLTGPSVATGNGHPALLKNLASTPVVLRHLLTDSRGEADHDDLPSGDDILAVIEGVGLRGRGGAAYPTAAKWKVAKAQPSAEKWVVANGDEGDPGSWIDRLLLERSPHAVLAGMRACGRAIGANRGVVYIRGEYPRARAAVEAALAEERFDDMRIHVVGGHGSYVVGEETALLNAIEGQRGEPRPKPPYPAVSGLFGKPTVVQNVETLSIIPHIVRANSGASHKAICVAGAVREPACVEVTLGTPLRRVLNEACGGPREGSRWTMALVGGPLGRVIPAAAFDVELAYDALPGLGHGGVVVFDASVSPGALFRHLAEFARSESCGSCTPCRVGSARIADMRDTPSLDRLLTTMEMGSLCGFGQGVPRPIRDLVELCGERVLG